MIASEGKYRRRIIAVRLVELIIVILYLTKIVDDVAQMAKELGHVLGSLLVEIRDHFVGDQRLVVRPASRSCIADGVEHKLTGRGEPARQILDVARRREIVEHPFGTIKQWMKQGAFLMRGLDKVRAEFSLTALVYNLRRALNILGVARLVAAVAG
jgi:hypothetical protein